jgi:hypothetical protein
MISVTIWRSTSSADAAAIRRSEMVGFGGRLCPTRAASAMASSS